MSDEVEYQEHSTALQNERGMYVLMGGIDDDSVKPVIEWILHENHIVKTKKPELTLMICSEGGSLSSAFALIDVMRSSTVPIKTVGLGEISSCGLLIFMAGTIGMRVLTDNTSILSHQFSWGAEGKSHELFSKVREFELTEQRMINHYRRCTRQDDDTIRKWLLPAHDVWLSAEEALNLGLCDAIADRDPVTTPKPTKPAASKKRKTK